MLSVLSLLFSPLQRNMIHASLTKSASGMGKLCQFSFKSILAFMGQGDQVGAIALARSCVCQV